MGLLGVLSVQGVPLLGGTIGLLFLVAFEVGLSRARKAGAPTREQLGSPLLVRLAVAVWVVAFVDPVWGLARGYAVGQALQAALFAVAVPVLLVLGGPWAAFAGVTGRPLPQVRRARPTLIAVGAGSGLASGAGLSRGANSRGAKVRPSGQRRGSWKAWLALGLFVASVSVWRTPLAVDSVQRVPLLVVAEAVWLCGGGVLLWLELVGSGPLSPRCERPVRMGIAAVAMWSVWIMGFVLGFSQTPWYGAYVHRGNPVSGMVDQEMTAALLFLTGVAAFVPLIFSTLITWLRSQDDTDEALYEALREEAARMAGRADGGGPETLAEGNG